MQSNHSSASLSEDQDKLFRTQSWSYFSLHSAQRMQSFQFYITLETALIGGGIVLAKSDGDHHSWTIILSAVISLLSFIFWKLDTRTRTLIKNSERALAYLDAQQFLPNINGKTNPLRLFEIDQIDNSTTTNIWNVNLSYSKCFNTIFCIFGFGGIIFSLQSIVTT